MLLHVLYLLCLLLDLLLQVFPDVSHLLGGLGQLLIGRVKLALQPRLLKG